MQPEDFEHGDPLFSRGLLIVIALVTCIYFFGPQLVQTFEQLIHRDQTILQIKSGDHELRVSGH